VYFACDWLRLGTALLHTHPAKTGFAARLQGQGERLFVDSKGT